MYPSKQLPVESRQEKTSEKGKLQVWLSSENRNNARMHDQAKAI